MADDKSLNYAAVVADPSTLTPLPVNAFAPEYQSRYGTKFVSSVDPATGETQVWARYNTSMPALDDDRWVPVNKSIATGYNTLSSAFELVNMRPGDDLGGLSITAPITIAQVAGLNDDVNQRSPIRALSVESLIIPADDESLYSLQVANINFNRSIDDDAYYSAIELLDTADANINVTNGLAGVVSRPQAFNGATWDRLRTNSAANVSSTTQIALAVDAPGDWSIPHTPAANTQATVSRAAGAAGVRHICTSISASVIGLAAAAADTTVLLALRDGATGAGSILWSQRFLIIVGGNTGISISDLHIVGSAATAMTLEFTAAGGANTFESVSLTGHSAI